MEAEQKSKQKELCLMDKSYAPVLNRKIDITELADVSIICYQGKNYMYSCFRSPYEVIYFQEVNGVMNLKD